MNGTREDVHLAVVVEAESLARLGMVGLLERLGARVVGETALGRVALGLAAERRATVIVVGSPTDMPQPELAQRLKDLPQPPRIVVVMERTDYGDLGMLLGLEVDAVVPRGAESDLLARLLQSALAGEQIVEPLVPGGEAPDAGLSPDGDEPPQLTARERDVLALLAQGRSNRDIASALYVSLPTVKTHLAHIYDKLGARNRNEAIGRASVLGWL